MTLQTIEPILRTLAAVDSQGSVELPWDRGIYSERVVQSTIAALQANPVASLATTQQSLMITARDPSAARLAIGLTLGLLLQFAAAESHP
jgi:hypothetical protein